MPSQVSPDENENVIIPVLNKAKNENCIYPAQSQSLDCCSLDIPSENTNLSDCEDCQASSTYTKVTTPSSTTQLTPLNPSLKVQFYRRIRKCIWIFPLFLVILVPFVCLIPYAMAVTYRHVSPFFPYVSDAGGITPQAGYFSQMLDFIAIFILITSFIRYKMLKHYINVKITNFYKNDDDMLHRLGLYNFISFIIICSSALGVMIIGNFRVTESPIGHFLGVAFAFGGMFVYMCFMVFMSYHAACCDIETKPYTMSVICVIAGTSLFGCMAFSLLSIAQAGLGQFFENNFRLFWTKTQNGYTAHIIGTAFEWVAINTVGPFYLCLFHRMKLFSDWEKRVRSGISSSGSVVINK